jgi:NADP-dependent 3-hydroxy acid dehydrogenase YdfG
MFAASAEPNRRRAGTALVTGANRGTGLAIAEHLESAGMRVWRVNRTGAARDRELSCDLSDLAAVDRVVREACAAADGRLDVFVANAVDRYFAPVAELDAERWSRALTVNLSSIVVAVRAALPALRAARGTIALMGSHAGSRFFETGASYCASKAALKAVCEVLLLEERRNGVRTCLVSPGAIANEEGDRSAFKMTTDSVAGLVEWIVSAPADLAVGEIELRPAALAPAAPVGLDRLQSV